MLPPPSSYLLSPLWAIFLKAQALEGADSRFRKPHVWRVRQPRVLLCSTKSNPVPPWCQALGRLRGPHSALNTQHGSYRTWVNLRNNHFQGGPPPGRLLARIRPFFSNFSFRHRVGALSWWEAGGRDTQGPCFLEALFNIFLTEFALVTSRTQARCKNQEQTLTRWPCSSPAKLLRSFKCTGVSSVRGHR